MKGKQLALFISLWHTCISIIRLYTKCEQGG